MTNTNAKFSNIKENSIGTLYVVATPIGNLEDITFRAVRILKEADLIICEDSSHSLRLLNHLGIKKRLITYNDHSSEKERNQIIDQLLLGKKLALISDAGTPLISDPGFKLVSKLHELNIPITPIPGASSVIAALSVSGIPTDKFLFLGFLPNNNRKSEAILNSYKDLNASLVLFESPKRVSALLVVALKVLGNRKVCLVRELTKIHEEIVYDNISELTKRFEDQQVKGEIVILIEGNKETNVIDDQQIIERLQKEISNGSSFSDSVKNIANSLNVNKKKVYDLALELKSTLKC